MGEAPPNGWHPYVPVDPDSVTGTVLRSDPIRAPQLGRTVELTAWIPRTSRRKPSVLYMHDGDNLFDRGASYSGEWSVDESLQTLGLDVVVVGIPNAGDDRRIEYAPWPTHLHAAVRGQEYADFVVERVMPFVAETLDVTDERSRTGVMGSSLGGLISIYLSLAHAEQFGVVGSMSTAAWWTPSIWSEVTDRPPPPGRAYLDVGTNEIPGHPAESAAYLESFERLRTWYESSSDVSLLAVRDDGGVHHESDWARRLPVALEFLFGGDSVS